jgi:ParB family chromosome partitioning protein
MQPINEKKKMSAFGLGRGLDSLIPIGDEEMKPVASDSEIDINIVDPNPMQPRTSFDEAPLAELAASIREYGILQPLLVSTAEKGRFQLIAGERRLRAAKLAGLARVPVIIRTLDEQKKLELAIIENVQRENLSPIEAALSYRRLMDEFGLTQEDVAAKVGKARSTIANSLRLLSLPAEIKQGLMEGKITEGHARSIVAIEDREAQIAFYHRIISEGLNVRQAEKHAKTPNSRVVTQKDPNVKAAEKKLSQAVGTKVKIVTKGTGGKVVIEFYDAEDLDRIYKKITE